MRYETQRTQFFKENNPNFKHGYDGTPTYKSWQSMKERCYNSKSTSYSRYGALNIIVCDRWLESFENFLYDKGERPEGMSLDRIDYKGDYTSENTRWANRIEQSRNRKSNKLNEEKVKRIKLLLEVKKHTQKQIAEMFGVSRITINDIKNKRTWGDI